MNQGQFQMFADGIAEADINELVLILQKYGWLTRKALTTQLGWTERRIRSVAEAAGADIVRGPRGFNVFASCSLDEIQHCAAIAESQGKKMIDYALALRRRAHERIA